MIKVIKLHYPILKKIIPDPTPQVVAMGFFDGVHLGHQAVIKQAKLEADKQGVPLAVLTYDPQPIVVFEMLRQPLRYLTSINQKAALLADLGVNTMYVMQFTSQLAKLAPQEFVNQVIMRLNPVTVVGGFDHVYGGDVSIADMDHLPQYAKKRFNVVSVSELDVNNQKIGSSSIRKALELGSMNIVNSQLGRVHQTTGLVIHGEARGRELGFPTVNIKTPELEWLPTIGIYAVKIMIGDDWHLGMASIGRNITFGDARPITVEINILDFNQQVYGENVTVNWYNYLRGEVKFTNIPELVTQLKKDEIDTRQYFDALN